MVKYFVGPKAANIVLLGTALISVIPTYYRLITKPGSERPQAWFIWAAAEGFFTLAVLSHWQGIPLTLLVPGLRVLANASIGLLALRKPVVASSPVALSAKAAEQAVSLPNA